MHSTTKVLWAVLVMIPLLGGARVFGIDIDDHVPEVTDRVARISFVRGDVQIKRADEDDWERAVLNLPLVEGDEIAAESGGRFEIQFNSSTFVRVDEKSFLKIEALRDEGIALSLPQGRLIVRASDFDPARAYLEVDAPRTTVSIQKSGMYRIDAGELDTSLIHVAATDGGEARIYTDSSGFTIRSGRRASIFVDGNYAGEWQMADAERFVDEFDSFALERDAIIAKRLSQAHYDRYYDRDIHGAEDLTDYGEWIYTTKYGYVWRPYSSALSSYADWSPYRYGQWRWVPPYGWTWVNDEPWGWATYHYGRWVWDNGSWYWTPYGYYRYRRSWWSPALVVINVINNNVCWYPLPYRYRYYDYNHTYSHNRRKRRANHGGWSNQQANNGSTPTPTPYNGPGIIRGGRNLTGPPLAEVPPGAVVSVAASDFGRDRRAFKTVPPMLAKNILSKEPDEPSLAVTLPTRQDLNGKVSQDIRATKAPVVRMDKGLRTGATDRTPDAPLDQELRKVRIFGNRPPLEINTGRGEIKAVPGEHQVQRPTGAVARPPKRSDDVEKPQRQTPVTAPPTRQVPEHPAAEPIKVRPNRTIEPVRPPAYEPPVRREKPRPEPVREQPVRQEPPKRRYEPPQKSETPRSEPSKKADPPPQKSVDKPVLPPRRSKDGVI